MSEHPKCHHADFEPCSVCGYNCQCMDCGRCVAPGSKCDEVLDLRDEIASLRARLAKLERVREAADNYIFLPTTCSYCDEGIEDDRCTCFDTMDRRDALREALQAVSQDGEGL